MTGSTSGAPGAPIKVGLTGSIAMGKSTTAQMFREAGAAVHDADAAVHRLYAAGGKAGAALRSITPDAVRPDGAVDREILKTLIAGDPTLLAKIEAVVHPLVGEDRAEFEAGARAAGAIVWIYDVPLLFETDAVDKYAAVIVVSAAPEIQRARALERPGMTEDHLERILARQTPDAEKRRRADFVVETDRGLDHARGQVNEIMRVLTTRAATSQGRADHA